MAFVVAVLGFAMFVSQPSIASRQSPTPPASPTPSASPSVEPSATVSAMWPQTSLEEVRQAQALADAGDRRYTWQVSHDRWYQPGQNHPIGAEFFARFMEEELGWEAFRWDEAFAHRAELVAGDVLYVRCAPGGTNPLYPDDLKDGCGPTIDDLSYETVKIHVAQLAREGASGIWVVTGWEMIEPAEQVAPPTDAEISVLLDSFLRARIDGKGAEGLVDVARNDPLASERVDREVPLLYGTSNGAAYERSEFEVVDRPAWPEGRAHLKVRLSAERGATVVEQRFTVERDESGRLRLVYDFLPSGPGGSVVTTTENGKAVPVTYGFLDGTVTYRAADPLEPSQDGFRDQDRLAIDGLLPDDDAPRRVLLFLADPWPTGSSCVEGPAPADAEALARSIGSDPDLEATTPVAVTIGGSPALQMDVVRGASSCPFSQPEPSGTGSFLLNHAPFGVRGNRARLWLLDLPGGPARVLVVAMITDDDSFEPVLAFAEPVVNSIELHTP